MKIEELREMEGLFLRIIEPKIVMRHWQALLDVAELAKKGTTPITDLEAFIAGLSPIKALRAAIKKLEDIK